MTHYFTRNRVVGPLFSSFAITFLHNDNTTTSDSIPTTRNVPIRRQEPSQRPVFVANDSSSLTKQYPFVIVGNGVAGKAAVEQIIHHAKPSNHREADVLVIDPHDAAAVPLPAASSSSMSKRVMYMKNHVTNMDLAKQQLSLSDGTLIKYHACLVATGLSEIDMSFGTKVVDHDAVGDVYDASAPTTRATLADAVENGQHVTLVGGDGWESVCTASWLAEIAAKRGWKGCVSLVTPLSGVLATSTPHYVANAIGKRLRAKGIEIVAYSQVRYIGGKGTFAVPSGMVSDPALGVYISRVHDSLYTNILFTDKIGMFPRAAPPLHGGAPLNCTNHFAAVAGLEPASSGGFLVNHAMLASKNVYVAGELANVPTAMFGRSLFSGVDHAHHTGAVAGRNMAGGFHIYSHVPVYEASAPESGVFLTWVGKCSTSNESHGYWWKINSSSNHHHHHHNDNHRTTTKQDEQNSGSKEKKIATINASKPPQGGKVEPGPSGHWGETLSSYFVGAPKKGASADSLLHSPPKGKTALLRLQQNQQQQQVVRPKVNDGDGLMTGSRSDGGSSSSSSSSSAASPALPPSPPLGLGVVFFTEDDIVTGVLIAGIPPARERSEPAVQGQQPSPALSYSEVMHERARSMIGKSANLLTAASGKDNRSNVEGRKSTSSSPSTSTTPSSPSSSSSSSTHPSNLPSPSPSPSPSPAADFRVGLIDVASYIMAPAIHPSTDTEDKDQGSGQDQGSGKGHDHQGGDFKLPRPLYRYAAPSKITHNRATAASSAFVGAPPTLSAHSIHTVLPEKAFHIGVGDTGSAKDKVSQAYALGLRYGLEGPPGRKQ